MGDPFLMLGEEGAEVAIEVFKLKRFGYERAKGYEGPLAFDSLHQEIGDFLKVMNYLVRVGKLSKEQIEEGMEKKRAKVLDRFGFDLRRDLYE